MFTGIITAVGKITRNELRDGGRRLVISTGDLDLGDVAVGDSIAVNGCCLTAVELNGSSFSVDVSDETLRCTAGLDGDGEVNLEKALRLADRLGGHLVSGHVDGVGEVIRFEPVGENWLLRVRAPKELGRYISRKGSITISGVSLTVNNVVDIAAGVEFEINLIPHTVQVTTFKNLITGSCVNLEVDMLARYIERFLTK